MIRVLLVDDHAIFRSGLKRLLADESDISVAGEADSSESALGFLRQGKVDVVMLDINMPGSTGLDTLRVIRKTWPELRVLMLSMYREKAYALHALQAGAHGYVTKDSAPEELLRAIRVVARGNRSFGGALEEGELRSSSSVPAHTKFSARELQVFSLIVRGVSLTQIAGQIQVSVKTVATHRRRILDKLQLDSNAEMISYAICHQLVTDESRSSNPGASGQGGSGRIAR